MVKKEIEKFKFIKKKQFTVDDNFAERFWESTRELSNKWERLRRIEGERSWRERSNNFYELNNNRYDQLRRDSETKLNTQLSWEEDRRYKGIDYTMYKYYD